MTINYTSIAIILASIFFTGIFAGAETGIYQLSRLRLRLGLAQKQLSYILLHKALRDTPGLLISTLVGTNIAVYVTTCTVSYIVLERTGSAHSAELLTTLITAPILFVFAELIPKHLFFHYPDSLMLRIGPLLLGVHRFLCWCGVIWFFKGLSGILARITHTPLPSKTMVNTVQRHETAAFFKDIHEESFLSAIQANIVNRLVGASNATVREVMIPLKKVQRVELNSDRKALLDTLKENDFTRLLYWFSVNWTNRFYS